MRLLRKRAAFLVFNAKTFINGVFRYTRSVSGFKFYAERIRSDVLPFNTATKKKDGLTKDVV